MCGRHCGDGRKPAAMYISRAGVDSTLTLQSALRTFSRAAWSSWKLMRAPSGEDPHIRWHRVNAPANASL